MHSDKREHVNVVIHRTYSFKKNPQVVYVTQKRIPFFNTSQWSSDWCEVFIHKQINAECFSVFRTVADDSDGSIG